MNDYTIIYSHIKTYIEEQKTKNQLSKNIGLQDTLEIELKTEKYIEHKNKHMFKKFAFKPETIVSSAF